MSASMAEGMAAILAEHPTRTQYQPSVFRTVTICEKCGVVRYIHQAEQLAANGYGKLPEPVTEWASAFRATGVRYNYHYTKAEAEDFVKEMKDVGADMVVITRQHTPATSTEWRQP